MNEPLTYRVRAYDAEGKLIAESAQYTIEVKVDEISRAIARLDDLSIHVPVHITGSWICDIQTELIALLKAWGPMMADGGEHWDWSGPSACNGFSDFQDALLALARKINGG